SSASCRSGTATREIGRNASSSTSTAQTVTTTTRRDINDKGSRLEGLEPHSFSGTQFLLMSPTPTDPPEPLPPTTPPTQPEPAPVTDPPSEPKPKGPFTV